MPVEFIPTDDEGDEPAPPPEPTPRRTLLLRGLAAALVAVLALVWAITRPDGGGVSGAPRPRPSRTVPPTVHSSPPTVESYRCGMGAPVTDELASAMRNFLPKVRIGNLRVFRCTRGTGPDGRVVFEAVSGRFHDMNIDVEASQRGVHVPSVSPRLGADGGKFVVNARIDAVAAGLRVSVIDWTRPGSSQPPPGDAMRRLADFVSLNVIL